MSYPKFKFQPSDCEAGFEAILFKSEAEEEAFEGELFDSPAEFHIITAPAAGQVRKPESYREHMAKWKSKAEKEQKPKKRVKA